MSFVPNCTVTIYDNSTTTDSWGDEIASTVEVATGVNCFIWEDSHHVWDAQQSKMITDRRSKCFLPHETPIVKEGRIQTNDGRWFSVSYVFNDSNPFFQMPIRCEIELSE